MAYTIRFLDYDETTVLQTSSVEEGVLPVYSGETPARAATAQYSYEFSGWDPTIVEASADADYVAQYTETVNKYTIRFLNEDNTTVLQSSEVEYGETPEYSGETPTKEATAQYTYEFSGWSPEVAAVVADVDYVAQYSETVNKYTIRFLNYDETVLQSSEVEYGETPAYSGETPAKPQTEALVYTFDGWDPDIEAVTEDADYVAQFTSEARPYEIVYLDEDGTVIDTDEVGYGSVPNPEDPTKEGSTFAGWVPTLEEVTGPAVYTASWYSNVLMISCDRSSAENSKHAIYMLLSEAALSDMPEDAGPGSIAFLPDLTKVYVLDLTKTWTETDKAILALVAKM